MSDIVRANLFTRINAILAVLFIVVVATGSLINGLFGLLIVANSVIGIVQELRAKLTLDRLTIVGQAKPVVRRDGQAREVPPAEVVSDDVIELGPGEQIAVDGMVVHDSALEVDESLLTGEADPVLKKTGDMVMSGSFVVAGSGAYHATNVGGDAYAAKLTLEAGAFTLTKSELQAGVNKILGIITYLLIPTALLIIYTQLFTTHADWRQSVLRTVGALVPMVPEGLVLMTSIAFAVGVIRLGQRRCLVQELPAIEALARVNVVCSDKTGTLTENRMQVAGLEQLDSSIALDAIVDVFASLAARDAHPNASMQAIAQAYPHPPGWTVTSTAPFKSSTKWSGCSFAKHGNWILGAPDVLQEPSSEAAQQAEAAGSQGFRVLLLGSSPIPVDHPDAPGCLTPVALITLRQRIRPDAHAALRFFAEQGVSVKILSGDNAASVGAVASLAGLDGQTCDARTLPTDLDELAETMDHYTGFGRVRPDQKRAMVRALQRRGNTVAMTGDGVNDVLALKDADIGVAMGAGSPASRSVAQIVLLDNSFASLPIVVSEGRRVIGNVERVANLFLTKTVYSALLALLVGLCGVAARWSGFRSPMFPFEPIQVTIAAWFTIGVPAFILSLAPNHEQARPGFVRRVVTAAVPNGTVAGVATFACYLLAWQGNTEVSIRQVQASTSALITLLVIAVWVLATVARPYTWWKVALVASSGGAYLAILCSSFARSHLTIDPSNVALTATAVGIGVAGAAVVEAWWWMQRSSGGVKAHLWQRSA